MRDLASRLIPVYQESDPDRYLANLSALQMVAGNYAAADMSRQSLRDRRTRSNAARPIGREAIYDLYAHARAVQAENRVPFAEAFAKSYHDLVPRLDDLDAYALTQWLAISPAVYRDALQKLSISSAPKTASDKTDAVNLIWAYLAFDAYRTFGPLVGALNAEDDQRRYAFDNDILIKTPDGASIAAVLVRPRRPRTSRCPRCSSSPSTMRRTMPRSARRTAMWGWWPITRGMRSSPHQVVPYQHDGDDARAVINWIAKQSWSDGRVGMYGDGYSGFAAWAAAKHLPPALKAIATSATHCARYRHAHGGQHLSQLGLPLVVLRDQYQGLGSTQVLRRCACGARWTRNGTSAEGATGTSELVYGKPNPIFIRWLNHPSYDRYWQELIPYREQFAHINIPVLTITGYYSGSEPGALYYFTQHHRFDPHADHTLLIGPYDDAVMERGPLAVLQGYQVDSVALVDLRELRYQWFDHVLKGGAMPPLLQNRVNFEVMGANEWRHAASLEAMANRSLKFYLDPAASSGGAHRLTQHKGSKTAAVRQTVNFTDRKDSAWVPSIDLINTSLATRNDVMFVSDALTKPIEFSGLFSGRLDFTVNKMDMDLTLILFERLASGEYVRLFSPSYEIRASYARDRVHRHLLKAGERQQLEFRSERMTSRQLLPGSRLVLVLGINKRPDREINYGTGNDVSEESIADGKVPLKIRWHSDSYIDIPVRR